MRHWNTRLGGSAGAAMLAVASCWALSAWAQSYPAKPVRIVVGLAPGGGTDIVTRLVGQKLAPALGQQIVVDNRPSAGGNVAAELVARAAPDGYALIVVTASHAVNPSLYKKMAYDPIKDFAAITQLTSQPYIFVVNPSVPARSVKEFVILAKRAPAGITYASSGSGLLGHLGMELLRTQANFKAVHVPYKGAGPALIDTVSGQVDAFFPTIISGLPQVKNARLRAIGVTTLKRSPLLPDVPTIAEQGFPGYEVSGWYGLLAPAATPKELIALLHRETVKVLAMADVKSRIEADGAEPVGNAAEAFTRYIQTEIVKWAKVVAESGARAD
ncbi:MAG: tripartite tricarboxylate transporter substrate binding protein [Burkholderiales bacterium]|nr:tripartite tricarboxylate transporter substrate binding protein [Burkholderiales bacterium]